MKNQSTLGFLGVLLYLFMGATQCTNPPQQKATFDEEAARTQILELHHLQRDYHVHKKAQELESLLADPLLSIDAGNVRPSKQEKIGAVLRIIFHRLNLLNGMIWSRPSFVSRKMEA